MSKGSKVFGKITYPVVAELFEVSIHTVKRWVKLGRLDLRNLKDIIDKYNDRSKLDYRKRQ